MSDQQKEMQGEKGFRKWAPLVVLSLALMIVVIDTTLLNVSLRNIIADLHTDIESMQWVITTYALILAAFTITGGRLGDLYGRKKMFMVGAAIFAVGSLLASISKSVSVLIIGESVIEGIGAVLMLPATASLLVSNYRGRDRAIAFGVWGGIAAAAASIGPVLGGWLTTNYTWRWGFRINLVVAAVLLLGSMVIREYKDNEEKPTIDFVGILLSALGLLSMVFGFIKASDYGWWIAKDKLILGTHAISLGNFSLTPAFILLGLIILALFILWERRMERNDKTPLVSLAMFKNRQFMTGANLTAILFIGQSGLSFAIPVFLQGVRNLDAFHTGLAMLPMSLALLFGAPFSAFLSKYIQPKRLVQAGILFGVLGFITLFFSVNVNASPWALAPGFALFGLGMGLMMAQLSNLTLSAVSVEESGEASGVNNTFRQIGATLGSAIMGAILLSVLSSNLVSGIKADTLIPPAIRQNVAEAVGKQVSIVEFGGTVSSENVLPQNVKDEITKITNDASVKGTKRTLLFGAIIIFLSFLVSLLLPDGKDIEKGESLAHRGAAAAAAETQALPEEVAVAEAVVVDEQEEQRRKAGRRRGATIAALILLLLAVGVFGSVWKNRKNSDSNNQIDFNKKDEGNRQLVQVPGENVGNTSATPTPTPTPSPTPTGATAQAPRSSGNSQVLGSATDPGKTAPTTGPAPAGYLTDTLRTFVMNMPVGWSYSQDSSSGDIAFSYKGEYVGTLRAYYDTNQTIADYEQTLSSDPGVTGLKHITLKGYPALAYYQNGKHVFLTVYKNGTYWFTDGATGSQFLSQFGFK